ncbi:MAG: T9SS type A sorting domain-containing protein [Bacteroidetes bacterium]|nr:T9SS type A sorting domain-containing protein [Bacteroidota bacterium]
MKAKLKIAASLALAAMSYTTINAQATVKWKQQLNGVTLHETDENAVWTKSRLDTLGKQLYYASSLASETYDFDPTPLKVNVKGKNIYQNVYDEEFGEVVAANFVGLQAISAYNTINGKLSWVNTLDVLSTSNNSFANIQAINEVGKSAGLYVALEYRGKIKYKSKVFTSVSSGAVHSNTDMLFMRLGKDGSFMSSASVVPVGATAFHSPGLSIAKIVNTTNGGLIALMEYNGETAKSFKIVSANTSKVISMNSEDQLVVEFDGNLKYVNHNIVQANGNYIYVSDIKSDASKNLLMAVNIRKTGNQNIDLDGGAAVNLLGASIQVDSTADFLIKFQPNLKSTTFKKQVDVGLCSVLLDKQSNIYLVNTLGNTFANQYKITNGITFKQKKDTISVILVKYDKSGNYQAHYLSHKRGETDGMDTKYFMDNNNNIFYSYTMNDINSSLGYRIFMSKIKTKNGFAEIWKNAIVGNSSSYGAAGSSIFAHNSEVFVGALLSPSAIDYKILVSNPLQKIKATGANSNSCIIKYALSGAALSPEEKAEGSNINVYKAEVSTSTALEVLVYPNPATEEVTIKLTNAENATATIYNYNSVAVKKVALTEVETKLNISELPAGMYFVEVLSNETKEIKKMIKN